MIYRTYRNYFKHLCTIHPSLLHSEDVGQQVFQLASLEEALGNTRSVNVEKGFMFTLIQPTFRLIDNEGDQVRQLLEGGFVMAKHYSLRQEGSVEYIDAIDECEAIVLDIVTKIVADSRAGHPLFYFSANNINDLKWTAQPVSNVGDGTYAGWLCLFEFNTSYVNCLDAHTSEAWKIPTPHNI